MSVMGIVREMFRMDQPQPQQTRMADMTIDDFLARMGRTNRRAWQPTTIREALGVPSIFRAVSLISTTTGALSLNAYRDGVLLAPDDRPRVMVRPDPFRKPRTFFRDTAWNMATTGEGWWWVAKRDGDGQALSLINMPPAEVLVEENPDDARYPWVTWRTLTTKRPVPGGFKAVSREDFRQLTLVQLPGDLRGSGPLQLCGAAVSVAVEAQDFAANFYGDGGVPSFGIKAAGALDPTLNADGYSEADLLRNQWIDKPNNVPRIYDQAIEKIERWEPNPQGAQMLGARDYQTGEAGRMFGIPGSLLDYSVPGSTLTYQNLEGEFTKWVRGGLWPYFLEEIEQEMSDLLTRSTVARFNIDALERPDIKTRFDVYKVGIDAGVLTPELAQEKEGIRPGDVEQAPVPFALPQAVPASIPLDDDGASVFNDPGITLAFSAEPVRCDGVITVKGIKRQCHKLLAEAGPFIGRCSRCGKEHGVAA